MSIYRTEHEEFLRKRKKEKRIIIISQISIILFFLIIWEILAQTEIINTFLTSSPINVIKTIINLHQTNGLYNHILVTVYETVLSFLIATVIGFITATILWWYPKIAKILDPYLTVINSLPKVALGPLIIIWVGASTNSIVFMALLISAIITIINIYNGFTQTDKNFLILLKSFKAKKKQIFFKVILPSNKNVFINALKINISMSLIGLLPPVGEKTFFNKCYSRY